MAYSDLHTHTTFSDGKNTPEEMVLAAIGLGMDAIGFSDHSYTPFDTGWCMPKGRAGEYRAHIAALKEKYGHRIRILCGIEQDVYSAEPTDGYDYVIASAHYARAGRRYIPVDESAATLTRAARRHFKGDIYALIEAYYDSVSLAAGVEGASIIGHFDLVTKFNEGGQLFDQNHPRYIAAWQRAADALLPLGLPFEINTGAISRGCRTSPYPAPPILDYLRARGARFILSGDSHSCAALCHAFPKWEHLL